MADTLKFRGLSTVQVTGNVAAREIVLDTELNQIAFGGDGTVYRFYNTTQIDAMIASLSGYDDTDGEELNDLTDVDIATQNLVYGDVLTWDGTQWTNSGVDISRSVLDNLGDVNITSPEVGDYIIWNGSSWVNYEAPSVRNLSDTLLTDPLQVNQSLVWNGSNWIDSYVPLGSASDVTLTNPQTNQFLVWNGSQWVNATVPLGDLVDVNVAGAVAGERLEYDGTNWVNVPNDADTLDGLDSLQFLRSDEDDTMTGTLTATGFSGDGSALTDLNASNISSGTIGDAYLPDTISSDITGSAAEADQWTTARTITLGGDASGSVSLDGSQNVTLNLTVTGGSAGDAGTLDGLDSTQFLRSDQSDTMTGTLTATGFVGNLTGTASQVVVTGTSANTNYRVMLTNGTGNKGTFSDAQLLYNPSTNVLTSGSYAGSGANLTGLNASNISSGTIINDRLPANISATSFSGGGANLTGLNASNISSGTIADARLPGTISSDITGNAATADLASTVTVTGTNANVAYRVALTDGTGSKSLFSDGGITYNASSNILTATGFVGSGASLTNLNASNISSGTIGDAYLPNSISSDITGNAATADNADSADTIVVTTNSNVNSRNLVFVNGTTGSLSPLVNTSITATPSSGTISATNFSGGGANLTSLNASNISSGTIADARLPGTISSDITGNAATADLADNATNADLADGFSANANGANAAFPIVVLNGTTPLTSQGGATINVGTGKIIAVNFQGGGSNLTSLNANNISSGTISDARLPGTISSDITGTATNATNVGITNNTTNTSAYVAFVNAGSGNSNIRVNSTHFRANLSNGRLTSNDYKGNGYSGSGTRNLNVNSSGVLTTSSSDASMKTNVADLPSQIDIVKALRPVSFTWIDTDFYGTQTEIGFLAQEVEPHVEEVIGINNDGTLTIDYPKLTSTLTKALQEALEKIEALETRLDNAGL